MYIDVFNKYKCMYIYEYNIYAAYRYAVTSIAKKKL